MVGDGHPDWGEDGCDSLDDTVLRTVTQHFWEESSFLEFYCEQPPFSEYFLRKLFPFPPALFSLLVAATITAAAAVLRTLGI